MIRDASYNGFIYGCTGNSLEEDVKRFEHAGANLVFTKPIAIDKLIVLLMHNVSYAWGIDFDLVE
jgi:hypothetical protein